MNQHIYNAIKEYTSTNKYPFHMPGHKRNSFFLPNSLLKLDVTEIGNLDNLHYPRGVIMKAQENIADIYGSDSCRMLVNGSSAGVAAAIAGVCTPGDIILLGRNSHISAYSGLAISGASPIYLYPEETDYGICGGYDPEKIKKILSANKNIKAVFLTSPTYEGFVSDIGKISTITHDAGKILIIDEAHGAHFSFHESFPQSSCRLGADIVIHSLHKTMPCFNQSALLHINGERVNKDRVFEMLSIMQTTSPSYILLSTIESCISFFKDNKEYFDRYVYHLTELRECLSENKIIKLMGKNVNLNDGIYNIDISKISLWSNNIKGAELDKQLQKYGIQIEMSGLFHIIAMTSVADNFAGYKELSKSIFKIEKEIENEIKKEIEFKHKNTPAYPSVIPELIFTPREAFYMEKENINIKDACGRISGGYIIPYPPGSALIAPGELITADIIEQYQIYKEYGVNIAEPVEYKIKVIKGDSIQ